MGCLLCPGIWGLFPPPGRDSVGDLVVDAGDEEHLLVHERQDPKVGGCMEGAKPLFPPAYRSEVCVKCEFVGLECHDRFGC